MQKYYLFLGAKTIVENQISHYALVMKKAMKKILILSAFFAVIDQLSKYFAGEYFPTAVTHNTGVAFGIEIPPSIIIILNIALIAIIIYIAIKELKLKHPLTTFSLALILGGALGNLLDRFTQGAVIDFISIWIYPVFNLADVFIVGGILLIIFFYAKIKKSSSLKQ
jgi:signal peptidase II